MSSELTEVLLQSSVKIGVLFVDETGKESQPFFFRQHDDRASSETWHVTSDEPLHRSSSRRTAFH